MSRADVILKGKKRKLPNCQGMRSQITCLTQLQGLCACSVSN